MWACQGHLSVQLLPLTVPRSVQGFSWCIPVCIVHRCKLPCPKWHLVAETASPHHLSLGPAVAAGSRAPSHPTPASVTEGCWEKKSLALQDSSANPSLGKFRWCYWWKLAHSPARARVLVLIVAFSITTTGVIVLLSERLWFHALKYKPIRTVFFSCVSLPNKQIELPRFIQSSHL